MSGYTDMSKQEHTRNCLRRIARHDEPQYSRDSIVNVMEKFVKTVKVMDDTVLVPCRLMDRQVGDSTDILPAPGRDSTSNQLTLNSCGHGKRGTSHSKNVHEFLNSAELFNVYSMLNSLKNDLLWTGKDKCEEEEFNIAEQWKIDDITPVASHADLSLPKTEITNVESVTSSTCTTTVKGHIRRPSTASVASTASVSNMSDSDSEISNENDSGVEFEGNKSDTPQSSAGSISSSEELGNQKKAANVDKATEMAQRCRRHLNGLFHCLEQMTEAANYLTARYQSDIGPV